MSRKIKILILLIFLKASACSSFPTPEFKAYSFPAQDAFIGNVKRPYQSLGVVKAKVNYQSLDPAREENELCRNYFNKAVRDLVNLAKDQGGDAVIDVKSVVFLDDGRSETYSTPECSDDGMEGQSLARGIAVRWKDEGNVK
jgi:hypothetical protein